ncbi:Ethylene-overproduction protein 1 [Morus notabilis]|uniref:Ethylene-overproduction protein 1 n=1 Tax=Morus notabilis TaxID=981085 RepID=W9QQQ7_9ROSA|nr:ethylene-overproduction protein 1 [Morus notabilis]EXB37965.1 Ethylene-overproduction protein 1 [Morus notabilis]
MRGLKLIDRFKSAQVHAFSPPDTSRAKLVDTHFTKIISFASNLKPNKTNFTASEALLLPYGFPTTDLLEPHLDPHLKPLDFVDSLADLYQRFENCSSESQKAALFVEQHALLRSLGDPKLLRRCLRATRQHAVDVQSKVVASAWLRFERREDELVGLSDMECGGFVLECPKAALANGSDPNSVFDCCKCGFGVGSGPFEAINVEEEEFLEMGNESDVSFCVGNEEIKCGRFRIARLSSPFKAMLYGGFEESKKGRIDFSQNGISVEGMRAVEEYSSTKRLDLFSPRSVLELLSFANRFCCEEMKSACDAHLASLVGTIEDALILVEYGLEERANLLVASCLQVLLRKLPGCLYRPKVMKFLCSSETRERLAMLGNANSFLLYYFLSQVAMEESMVAKMTVKLLKRLGECATERWQKALASHQLGCVLLERREFIAAQCYFEAAVEAGHVYSMAGIARAKYKIGQQYSAYKLMSSVISEYKQAGWMYQERSLYNIGKEKISDLSIATEMDPTLSFPYKHRAVAKMEEKQIRDAILEIDKIIGFKLSPDCLESRAWFFIALEDYENAMRDIRVVLTLEPNYMMFGGKVRGDYLVEVLGRMVRQLSQADCWMCLYERWSSVDDIGSLAIIHQMLESDPANSVLRFRQSLLLLRLNCQRAAMRSLRLARNHSTSEYERLVYEGWILYDTGNREEALSRAERSIVIQRSFEAFFLKAYVLADTNLNPESSSCVIQLLEEALKCPSDGLRKGQALNNLGSIYVDCGNLDGAANCYKNALDIKHTRAHQGLARVYHLRNQRKVAHEEMTKLIGRAQNNASAYEKRSEYCDREMAKDDLDMATKLDPLRTYPYRYRAAVLMDDQKDNEAVEELTKPLNFRLDLQMLHLRAAFYDSMGDVTSALRDCQAALCLDPNHTDTLDLYNRAHNLATHK